MNDKIQPTQEPALYIRKDHLQKAAKSATLCEVTPEPRPDLVRIYTTPQPRPWVELTQSEKQEIYRGTMWKTSIYDFADALLAAVKEKNT